jgi:hypothetical protein
MTLHSLTGRAAFTIAIALSASVYAEAQQPTVTGSVNGTLVTIEWTPVAGALAYDVEVSGSVTGGTTVGASPTAYSVNAPAGTYTLRIRARAGGIVGPFSNPVTFSVGGPAAPTPGPSPVPSGNRTPDPPPGTILPLPGYGPTVVGQMAAAFPGALANSCGNNEWLLRLVYQLRQIDTRWGLNWKRGNVGDLSQDVVTYHFGAGPDENSTDVYIIDVIFGHCGGRPGPNWGDVTAETRHQGTIGRWTILPLLPYLPR